MTRARAFSLLACSPASFAPFAADTDTQFHCAGSPAKVLQAALATRTPPASPTPASASPGVFRGELLVPLTLPHRPRWPGHSNTPAPLPGVGAAAGRRLSAAGKRRGRHLLAAGARARAGAQPREFPRLLLVLLPPLPPLPPSSSGLPTAGDASMRIPDHLLQELSAKLTRVGSQNSVVLKLKASAAYSAPRLLAWEPLLVRKASWGEGRGDMRDARCEFIWRCAVCVPAPPTQLGSVSAADTPSTPLCSTRARRRSRVR
jgi:hypothetical protein